MADYTLSAIFRLTDRLSSPLRNINSNLAKVGITSDNVVNKIQKIGSVGAKAFKVIGVAGLAAGLAGSKIAMDFEALSARMNTAFKGDKKKAAEYYSWANKFANETPFSNEEVVSVVGKLALQGYDPKEIMKSTGGNLLQLLGDAGGAMGKSLDQAFEAFDDVSRGEFERLKEFGITKSNIQDELSKIGKENAINAKGQVVNSNAVMEATIRLMNGRFKGGMVNLANTLKGKVSTSVGNFKFAIAQAMGVMEDGTIKAGSAIERLKGFLDKLNNFFASEKFQASLKKWGDVAVVAFGQIETIGRKLVDYFKTNFPSMFGDSLDKLENFDATDINKGLDSIIVNFDKMMEKLTRLTGAYIGFQLGMAGGAKGALLGASLGLFAPEIVKGIEKWSELTDEKNSPEETERKRKVKEDYDRKQELYKKSVVDYGA
ncbi:MAG: hypothetical protein ACRC6U_03090, partial [Fusobacteriaceae bacterium]